MVREDPELRVSFDFTNEATGLKASFNSPTQRAFGLPLRNVFRHGLHVVRPRPVNLIVRQLRLPMGIPCQQLPLNQTY